MAAGRSIELSPTPYQSCAVLSIPGRVERLLHSTVLTPTIVYVATSTPLGGQWHNATAIEGGLVEFVRSLKRSPGGDIGVHASVSVGQALLAGDVVDEVRLVVAPAIAGGGRRLLDGLPPTRLEAIRSATSPSGYLLADYRIAR